jgi:hypothetical protein
MCVVFCNMAARAVVLYHLRKEYVNENTYFQSFLYRRVNRFVV